MLAARLLESRNPPPRAKPSRVGRGGLPLQYSTTPTHLTRHVLKSGHVRDHNFTAYLSPIWQGGRVK